MPMAHFPSPHPAVETAYNQGLRLLESGKNDAAAEAFLAAAEIDGTYHPALAELAKLSLKANQNASAMTYIALALRADPHNAAYHNLLSVALSGAAIVAFSPDLKRMIQTSLETAGVEHSGFLNPWLFTLKNDPSFQPLWTMMGSNNYKTFKKTFLKIKSPEFLLEPFFLLGLQNLIVAEPEFEIFLTHLSRLLLESLGNTDPSLIFLRAPDWIRLRCALAVYCFYVGYIFDACAEERQQAADLRQRIESLEEAALIPNAPSVATVACYQPLVQLANATAISRCFHSLGPEAALMARCQIDEPFEEEGLKASIVAITPLVNETSLQVQQQYEEFPYPRWKSYDSLLSLARRENADSIHDLLVAGCGTGLEAILHAVAYPQAKVLAIDLSRSSLSYGLRMVKKFGIRNIEFCQADILELGGIGRSFDLIASSGVLHHLKNPADGLAVLSGLLKPGGLMRIALYSRTARRDFAAAQMLAAKQYGSDADSIRQFRRDAPGKLKSSVLKRLCMARDYYSMAECRDLLFHVMENQFDLPDIESLLRRFDLGFLRFDTGIKTTEFYRQHWPDDPPDGTLEHWAMLEQKNPLLFIRMYSLLCRKNACQVPSPQGEEIRR
jgi:SAM-dependent methyltransferase